MVLGINQIYFSQKKNSVEMFSAYMQEVNFKKIIIFNLFYLHFCFGHHVCIGNSSLRISGLVSLHGSIRNIILLHTHHTSSTLHQQLFSSHHSQFTHVILAASPSRHEKDQPFFECYLCLLTCIIVSRISFTRMNQETI
jgi:hypothetical protein